MKAIIALSCGNFYHHHMALAPTQLQRNPVARVAATQVVGLLCQRLPVQPDAVRTVDGQVQKPVQIRI